MARTLADLSPEQIRMLYGDNFVLDQQEGPMTDQDLYDQFPMWGNENERRFDKYAPVVPEMPQSVQRGMSQPQQVTQAPQAPEMQNYFQRTTPGNVGPKVSMDYAAQPQRGGGQAFDYSSPIEIAGFGKGYRMKGDPSRIVLADGRIVRTGVDSAAEAKAKRDQEEMAIKRMVAEAQVRKLDRTGGIGSEEAQLAARAKIPGTKEWERVQKEERTKAKNLTAAEATRRYAAENASMLETSLADILGVKPEELESVLGGKDLSKAKSRVAASVGSLDARFPTVFQDTQNVDSAVENLKSKAQMFGLANLRQSGVAPGSITEKEWPKFESTLGNIDPRLGEDAFVKQLQDIYRKVKSARNTGELDYRDLVGDEEAPTQAQQGASFGNLSLADKEALSWAMKNQGDPRATAIKAKLGVR